MSKDYKFVKALTKRVIYTCDYCGKMARTTVDGNIPLCDICNTIPVDEDYDYMDYEIKTLEKEEQRAMNELRRNNETTKN